MARPLEILLYTLLGIALSTLLTPYSPLILSTLQPYLDSASNKKDDALFFLKQVFVSHYSGAAVVPEVNKSEVEILAEKCREHTYSVRLFSRDPLVLYLDGFVSLGEAEYLVGLAYVSLFSTLP